LYIISIYPLLDLITKMV